MMQEFFETLFGGKPDKDFILTWEKYNGQSTWHRSIQEAVACASRSGSHDIYVGVGTSPQNYGPKKRCLATDITGIPGFWLDIDMKHECHKKANLPETEEDLQKILSVIPYEPTITIHSGHGRQCWWIFNEFWSFDSIEEHDKAAILSRKFTVAFRDRAKSYGWEFDMTHDLARILRIPGTMNLKSEPVPVTMIRCNGSRYNPDDLEEVLPEEEIALPSTPSPTMVRAAVAVNGERFVLDHNAEPPADKMVMLMEIEPKFKSSWEMTRRFPSGKNSGSEYDLSLATFALQTGWTWQETVNLLIAFRRKHDLKPKTVNENDPLSPLREQYYLNVLTKAGETSNGEQTKSTAKEKIEKFEEAAEAAKELPEEQKTAVLTNHLSDMLKIPIKRLICYDGSDPQFCLETDTRQIMLGGANNVLEQRLFRNHLGKVRLVPPNFNKDRWCIIARALMDAAVVESMGEDFSDNGTVKFWIMSYLQAKAPLYDRHEAYANDRPFVQDRKCFILTTSLRSFLRCFQGESVTPKVLAVMMRQYGFTPHYDIAFKVGISQEGGKDRLTKLAVYSLSIDNELIQPFIDLDLMKAAERE